MAIVSIVIGDAVGCGGRMEAADCGEGRQYCAQANVCCPDYTTCGTGTNGCPPGDCCLNSTVHIVDGGSSDGDEGALTPTELPPPTNGSYGPSTPDPGILPGGGGGGGGGGGAGGGGPGSASPTTPGGEKRS